MQPIPMLVLFSRDENWSITARKLENTWNNRCAYKHFQDDAFPISVLKSGIIYNMMLKLLQATTASCHNIFTQILEV